MPRPDETSSKDPEGHTLARQPDAPDGLSPEKAAERTSPTGTARDGADKPYTSEHESYGKGPAQRPDHPTQREDAHVAPRR